MNPRSDTRKAGRWKRLIHRLAGSERSRRMLSSAVRRETGGQPPFSFPLDNGSIGSVIIILPPDQLQALYQLRNVRELAALFRNASLTLVAESSCAPLARLIEGAHIEEYPIEEKRLFSAALTGLSRKLKGTAALCFLLTHEEDLPLLFLAGTIAAPVRIGYAGTGGPPFLNLHIDPAEARVHASDRNAALAEMLGAKKIGSVPVRVSRNTAAEIDHLFRELHIAAAPQPAGIDALFFYRTFGAAWAEGCIRALIPFVNNALYLYAEGTHSLPEQEWLSSFSLPVIHNLTIPQTAALVARSGVVVAGNTLLFGLATLFDVRAAGIFARLSLDRHCPAAPLVRGIAYENVPDETTTAAVTAAVAELLAGPPAAGLPVQ